MEGWMEDSILPSIVLETNFGLKDVPSILPIISVLCLSPEQVRL